LKVGHYNLIALYHLSLAELTQTQPSDTFNPFPCFLEERKLIPGDTASDDSFQTIKLWIENCTTNHKKCGSGDEQPLPTRVLDLGAGNPGPDTDTIRLFLTENQPARYACLSYCWGNPEGIVKTTKESLGRHCGGISVLNLPKTFRDTITVARKLGLRYLWIDSLCIIQNDLADWERESSRMADVYQNSYVTIAAAKSSDVQGGLFSVASPAHSVHSLSYVDANGTPATVYTRWALPHSFGWTDIKNMEFPLYGRGWTYQERLLAPRVLSFGPHELIMECVSFSVCECSKEQDSSDSKYRFPKLMFGEMNHQPMDLPSKGSDSWNNIVETYSQLALTVESDKLSAISGIAKAVQQHTGSFYAAGLWSSHLPRGLGWGKHQSAQKRPSQWRAPTWSWASVDGPVGFVEADWHESENLADVIDVKCERLSKDTTGQLKSGYLTLLCTPIIYAPAQMSKFRLSLEDCSFDYIEDKKASLAGAPIWWVPISTCSNNSSGPFTCLVLKETQKKIKDIPNLNMDLIREHRDAGMMIHQFAMERVGLLPTHMSRGKRMLSRQSATPKTIVVLI